MKRIFIAKNAAIFPIGLGAMPLSISGRPSATKASNVIKAFLDNGGHLIDTADVYGLDDTDRGHNEKLIYQTIKKMGAKNLCIATKGGATRPLGGWGLRGGGHPKMLRNACETSLRHLDSTSIDLYYLHGPDPYVPIEDSLGELTRLKEEGKIQNIGIANVNLQQLTLAASITTLAAVQNRCNPFCKSDLTNGVLEFCKSKNLNYVPYCPLGGWADHTKLMTSNLFDNLTKKYNVSSYEISLAWLLHKSDIIIPIPGMDKADQIEKNFNAVKVQLENIDISKIDAFPDLYSPAHIDT